jgi:hypothetical protein
MNDDDISCKIPDQASSAAQGDTIYCKLLIELMQLSSAATRRLSRLCAQQHSPRQILDTVGQLNVEMESFKSSAQSRFPFCDPVDPSHLPSGLSLRQAQSLRFHYFAVSLDINTPLTYPWSNMATYLKPDTPDFTQMRESMKIVSQISRSTIMETSHIQIDAHCPSM